MSKGPFIHFYPFQKSQAIMVSRSWCIRCYRRGHGTFQTGYSTIVVSINCGRISLWETNPFETLLNAFRMVSENVDGCTIFKGPSLMIPSVLSSQTTASMLSSHSEDSHFLMWLYVYVCYILLLYVILSLYRMCNAWSCYCAFMCWHCEIQKPIKSNWKTYGTFLATNWFF